jgi:5-formaminoimidazole-4-carboxamide-1-beta-D-ribofuranosyl 5'-monophosphate synthetase
MWIYICTHRTILSLPAVWLFSFTITSIILNEEKHNKITQAFVIKISRAEIISYESYKALKTIMSSLTPTNDVVIPHRHCCYYKWEKSTVTMGGVSRLFTNPKQTYASDLYRWRTQRKARNTNILSKVHLKHILKMQTNKSSQIFTIDITQPLI